MKDEVTVGLRLTSPTCLMVGYFCSEIASTLRDLAGDRQVRVTYDLGLDWSPNMIAPEAAERRQAQLRDRSTAT